MIYDYILESDRKKLKKIVSLNIHFLRDNYWFVSYNLLTFIAAVFLYQIMVN